ncbi:Hsp20/alpha crystallin family protein [Tautonia sociabilis]|uniref:Hsp20/alpha crystallin family protein n=1 Tax=Tautonia sociabilis TaxID=2080755 RepID=A0A432MKV2_9BACT|nr:Hsp20/alpha crystallin family protein [Tautonia sociabilis]RUL88054.1 Hsp20/alpha crystallin family protein [Tautonia sociabilis]
MPAPELPIRVADGRDDADRGDGLEQGFPARSPRPIRPGPSPVFRTPPIDIFEEPGGLVLLADLPGCSEDSVSIELESNLLTLRAEASRPVPEGAGPMLEEAPPGPFQRTFILSDEVDRSRISAELKHGVLRLRLPKAERAKPRRIEIRGMDGEG